MIRIEGEVARPGDYEHRVGMRLSELVNRADGLTVDAYLPQVFVSRQLGDVSIIEGIPGRTGHLQSRRILVADLGKALKGDPELLYAAVAMDPLTSAVLTLKEIRDMVIEMLEAQREWLPQYEGKALKKLDIIDPNR